MAFDPMDEWASALPSGSSGAGPPSPGGDGSLGLSVAAADTREKLLRELGRALADHNQAIADGDGRRVRFLLTRHVKVDMHYGSYKSVEPLDPELTVWLGSGGSRLIVRVLRRSFVISRADEATVSVGSVAEAVKLITGEGS